MTSPVAPPLSPGVSKRVFLMLSALVVALGLAFVFAPRVLASKPDSSFDQESDLRAAFRPAFVEYWRSGAPDFPPSLNTVVDYWFRYHLAKAFIAAMLLVVLIAFGLLLWKTFLRAGDRGPSTRYGLASAGSLVALLGVSASVLLMANIQGTITPFASLLPMATGTGAAPDLTETLDQIKQRLADSQSTGARTPPALELMINEFARYHAVMAVIAAIMAILLLGAAVALWMRFAKTQRSDTRTRRVLAAFGVLTPLFSLAIIVVAVVNTATAADPTPALAALFDGGW